MLCGLLEALSGEEVVDLHECPQVFLGGCAEKRGHPGQSASRPAPAPEFVETSEIFLGTVSRIERKIDNDAPFPALRGQGLIRKLSDVAVDHVESPFRPSPFDLMRMKELIDGGNPKLVE
jgi:hypothetical protein